MSQPPSASSTSSTLNTPRLEVLLSRQQIADRVAVLAKALRERLGDRPDVSLLVLLRGAVFFFVDLLRALGSVDYSFDLIKASSYADSGSTDTNARQSRGNVDLDERALKNMTGKTVLLIDDIIDTGLTLSTVATRLKAVGAKEVLTVVLLDKPSRRKVNFHPDYVGFEIPDYFVVGYGLDCAGKYRNLPDICVLHPTLA